MEFVQAYLQETIAYDLYMKLPKGFKNIESDGKTHVLQLLKNLYRQNQSGHVWNHHLNDALNQIGFKKSDVDKSVWHQKNLLLLCR